MTKLGGDASASTPRPPAGANETIPIVFGDQTPLAGVLTLPGAATSLEFGAVVCAPLGLENVCTYRPLRTLAERIADRGVPVLRFDWAGYGDSADPPPRANALELWLDAIGSAVAKLRSEAGVAEVALLGLRIGATLAMLEAARSGDIGRLALLAPHVRGRAYLRELAAFEAVADQTAFSTPALPPPPLPPGSFETGGFLFSASERRALEAIDLRAPVAGGHVPARVLIVATQTDQALESFAEGLAADGSSVVSRLLPELAHVWESSQQSYLPPDCSAPIVDWLVDGCAARAPRGETSVGVPALMRLDDGAICEEATMLETGRGRLFAVTCASAENLEQRAPDWVVFLNTGRIRRGGTSRLSTNWARRWARAGVPSIRLDVLGVGDSDGIGVGDEVLVDDPSISYSEAVLTDVRAALAWLAEHHHAERFMVIGLCSGATIGFELALSEPQVVGAGLINTPAWHWDDRLSQLNAWREARLAGTGLLAFARTARGRGRQWTLRALSGALVSLTGSASEVWGRPRVRTSLGRLRADGTRVAAIYSERDFGLEYLAEALGPDYRDELARAGVTLEIVKGPDHTFRPLWSHAVLTDFLERLLRSIGFLDHSTLQTAARVEAR